MALSKVSTAWALRIEVPGGAAFEKQKATQSPANVKPFQGVNILVFYQFF